MNKLNSTVKTLVILLLAIMVIIAINPMVVQAQQVKEITIMINGEKLETDVAPVVRNNRTLVPFRAIFERLGAREIEWDPDSKAVIAYLNDKFITLRVGDPEAEHGGQYYELDSAPIIKDGRVLVPLRFIIEITGEYDIQWIQEEKLVKIDRKEFQFYNEKENKGINLGDNVDKVIENFGQPARKDKDVHDFTWYIYNQDLSNYFQIGVKDDQIVAFATNAVGWKHKDYKIGQRHKELLDKDKGRTSNGLVSIYTDIHFAHRISSMSAIDFDRLGPVKYGPTRNNYTQEHLKGMALQMYDLTNSYRARFDRAPLPMDDSLLKLAEYHANDMTTNKFFSHTSSDGKSLYDRAKALIGITNVSENISLNTDSVSSISSLYNSKGHRNNMLNPQRAAIGTAVGATKEGVTPVFVQVFKTVSPR